MERFKYFKDSYECGNKKLITIDGQYRVVDPEHDPYYKNISTEYRKYIDINSVSSIEFERRRLEMMQLITDYFVGEYTETTDDDFQDVFATFFERWYWDDVYVCYSPEILEIEKQSWRGKFEVNWDKAQSENPYRLFKLVKKLTDDVHVYSSVFTGYVYEIDTSITPLVYASANNGRNYLYWTHLIKEFISAEQAFIQTQRLASKRIMRQIKNPDSVEAEDVSLDSVSTVFDVDTVSGGRVLKNKYEPFDACTPEIPRGLWDNLLNWFQTRAGWLGYLQNMNDKRERLTTGENFKDTHSITNVQYRNLKALNKFGRLFNKKYPGHELNFNVSNWGEAQGLPQGEFSGEEIDNLPSNNKDNGLSE